MGLIGEGPNPDGAAHLYWVFFHERVRILLFLWLAVLVGGKRRENANWRDGCEQLFERKVFDGCPQPHFVLRSLLLRGLS